MLNFPANPSDGDTHTDNGVDFVYADPPGCWKLSPLSNFTQLGDTPADYVGQAGKLVAVALAENALEFVDGGGGATVHVGELPPEDPEQGDMWFATGETVGLFVWYVDADSSQWVQTNGGGGGDSGGGASITVGPDFPSPVDDSALHYKTSEVVGLYVRYNDGNSTQWVQTNGGGGGAEPAPTGNPAGTVIDFAGATPPEGYVKCDGTVLNVADYPALFAAIGATYGGDGATTFAVPDLRGEFIRGWDDGRGVDSGRGMGSFQDQLWRTFQMTDTVQNGTGYSHGPVDMGNSTTSFIGKLFTGGWAAPSAAIGTKWNTEEIRPRNVALLKCIKT